MVGATKAIDFKLNPLVAALLGMVSAVGGGVVRDILLNRVPTILQEDIYAVAALAGAATTVLALPARRIPGVVDGARFPGVLPAADHQPLAGLEPAQDRRLSCWCAVSGSSAVTPSSIVSIATRGATLPHPVAVATDDRDASTMQVEAPSRMTEGPQHDRTGQLETSGGSDRDAGYVADSAGGVTTVTPSSSFPAATPFSDDSPNSPYGSSSTSTGSSSTWTGSPYEPLPTDSKAGDYPRRPTAATAAMTTEPPPRPISPRHPRPKMRVRLRRPMASRPSHARSRAWSARSSVLLLVGGGLYLIGEFGFRIFDVMLNVGGQPATWDIVWTSTGAALIFVAVLLNGWSPWATLVPGLLLTAAGVWSIAWYDGADRVATSIDRMFARPEMVVWGITGWLLVLGLMLVGASGAAIIARAAGRRRRPDLIARASRQAAADQMGQSRFSKHCGQFRQHRGQRPATVRQHVLLRRAEFGRRPAVAGGVALHRDEHRVVAEPVAADRFSDDPAAPFAADHPDLRPRHRQGERADEGRPRRSSGTSPSWASSKAVLAGSSPCVPDQRADSTPGMPLSASTASPESSARLISPVSLAACTALATAFSSNVAPVSGSSSNSGTSSRPEHLHLVAQDPLQFGELLGVPGGQQHPAHDLVAWVR